jgi:putative hemolysin
VTPADAALPAWEILLDGKPGLGLVVASNQAEALRQARIRYPHFVRRISARVAE